MLDIKDINVGDYLQYWENVLHDYAYFFVTRIEVVSRIEKMLYGCFIIKNKKQIKFTLWLMDNENISRHKIRRLI